MSNRRCSYTQKKIAAVNSTATMPSAPWILHPAPLADVLELAFPVVEHGERQVLGVRVHVEVMHDFGVLEEALAHRQASVQLHQLVLGCVHVHDRHVPQVL